MLCLAERTKIKEDLIDLIKEHDMIVEQAKEVDNRLSDGKGKWKDNSTTRQSVMSIVVYLGIDLNDEEKKIISGNEKEELALK